MATDVIAGIAPLRERLAFLRPRGRVGGRRRRLVDRQRQPEAQSVVGRIRPHLAGVVLDDRAHGEGSVEAGAERGVERGLEVAHPRLAFCADVDLKHPAVTVRTEPDRCAGTTALERDT